ncbi:hypothetical protein Tco_1008710, partial [Tanacetum coccineum]
ELAATVDSKETEEDEETPLINRRQTGVFIGSGVHQEIEDFILKERPKGVGEGFGMAREVPDGPSGSFSSLSSESDDEIEDISSDDERSEADDTEKVDEADAKKADDSKKAEDEKDVEEHAMCHTPQRRKHET